MKHHYYQYLLSLSLIIFLSFNFKTSAQVPEKQYLLNKSSIKINNLKISQDELNSYIKQKPNRRILGFFKFHYTVYKIADGKKETRFNKWLKNTIGEAPVYLDTNLTNSSITQIGLYLNSKGYFFSDVKKTIKYGRRKANVTYIIKTSKPYTYRNINFSSQDSAVQATTIESSPNSLLHKGDIYDFETIEHERERITINLKNHGYFRFSKEFISFKIDSSLNTRQMDVQVIVSPFIDHLPANPDSVIYVNHKLYTINNTYVHTDYNSVQKDSIAYDTLLYKSSQRKKGSLPLSFYFLYSNKLKYKPKTITQAIFVKNNRLYNINDVQETYNSLSALQNFKFINVNFEELYLNSNERLLDCKIKLTRLPKQSFSIETEGTYSGGDPGVGIKFGYQNINLFRGAEILNMKLKLALEAQKTIGSQETKNLINHNLPFNTIETGVETNIEIPKFLVPLPQELFSQYNKPKTNINIGFNYQKRSDFRRYISNVSFGYRWKETKQKTHILNPIEVSSVNIDMDSTFEATINALNDRNIQNSYLNHLTAGMKYTYILNTQQINKATDFIFFRGNTETAGNLLWFTDKYILKAQRDKEGFYRLLNNRFAQYWRIDGDFRFYDIINSLNSVVYRVAAGLGIPYLNAKAMPFEKSFFSGGANGIRAWEIRSLGPGSFADTTDNKFDKTGDIKIEANIEYRFPIYKLIKGAAFIDAGNIWYKNKNAQYPEGNFRFDRFYKEIALGWGLGLRVDFSFFVIRIDAAAPMKNPANKEGNRWVIKNTKPTDVILNFGIGYPF